MWTKEDSDATLAKLNRIKEHGVARARIVQAEIDRLRADLRGVADNLTLSDLRRAGPVAISTAIALLQSYDAEMTRLCALPGVLDALLADVPTDAA